MTNAKQFASYGTDTRYLENAVGNYELWYLAIAAGRGEHGNTEAQFIVPDWVG